MKSFRPALKSMPWLSWLRWSFACYMLGTLLAAGLRGVDYPQLAGGILVLTAAGFVFSLVCAVMAARESRLARGYLLLVLLMAVVVFWRGNG